MKEKYPQKRFKFSGRSFWTVFVYLPDGPQVFIGTINRIYQELKTYPTSHAIAIRYRLYSHDESKKIIGRRWMILGKDCDKYSFSYSIDKKRRKKIRLFKERQMIAEWRKLPQKHLKQFKSKTKYSFISS